MAGMRRSLKSAPAPALLLLALFVRSSPSAAQHCSPTTRPAHSGVHAAITQITGTFQTSAYEGDYEGLATSVGWGNRLWQASLSVPAYRLVRNGRRALGIGDLRALIQHAFVQDSGGHARLSATLEATLPSGDADEELGMGHLMAIPGLLAGLSAKEVGIELRFGYAQGLHSSGGHRHRGGRPLVDPMNDSEAWWSALASAAASEHVTVELGTRGAVGLLGHNDADRGTGLAGVRVKGGAYESALSLEVPFVGDPYRYRTFVELRRRF
jgi:hypothetical protein